MESLETRGDEGLEGKTDASAGFITVDLDGEILPCWTKVGDLGFLQVLHLHLPHCCLADSILAYIMEMSSTYRTKRMTMLHL